MESSLKYTAFYGSIVTPIDLDRIGSYPHCLLGVGPTGIIDWIVHDVAPNEVQNTLAANGLVDIEVTFLKEGEFLMPGFIDTHSHAPQFPNLGVGLEYQLLDWLQKVVFPTERRFCDKNLDYAKTAYKSVIRRVLDCGTTTCCYYGSLYRKSTEILAEIAHEYGQRAFIGKCNMNRPVYCPPDYIEDSTEDSMKETRLLIEHIRGLDKHHHHHGEEQDCQEHDHDEGHHHHRPPLVQPIITPRFALSCTKDLLDELGKLAKEEPSLIVQTHLAENPQEVEDVLKIYGVDTYTDVYKDAGLLRENTIFGHGIYLNDKELKMIREHGAGVAHCPGSNFYLTSGVAEIGKYLDKGVKVGLGTDVAGGYSPSLLNTIQNASIASKVIELNHREKKKHRHKQPHHKHCHEHLEADKHGHEHGHKHGHEHGHKHGHDHDHKHSHEHGHKHGHKHPDCDDKEEGKYANKQLSIATLFYLATLGGAHLCGLGKYTGSLEMGKAFDALLISTRGSKLSPTFWDPSLGCGKELITHELLKELLERFMFNGDDRSIQRVYVQGKLVGGTAWGRKHKAMDTDDAED